MRVEKEQKKTIRKRKGERKQGRGKEMTKEDGG